MESSPIAWTILPSPPFRASSIAHPPPTTALIPPRRRGNRRTNCLPAPPPPPPPPRRQMCTYYYLHYHHVAPCARDVEYAVHYAFCPNATMEPITNSPLRAATAGAGAGAGAGVGGGGGGHGCAASSEGSGYDPHHHQLVQQPCEELTQAPECDAAALDYANPCATGGCLVSQHCASGGCRLDELGGRWACCRCGRGGNAFRWCVHRVRGVPDALCYHVVCRACRVDAT
ncbi:hypothetical protein F4802DRAFT_293743 [Xylaria palmicola]|nr:hypothetical protein F4802DRAFT_293743 [Xylaria palmicola]